MEELLKAYWYPLYAFVRRSRYGKQDAQDITQNFIAHVLDRDVINQADRDKGRFRSFLIGVLKNYLANVRRHDTALKRGGDCEFISIDDESSEERYLLDAEYDISPIDEFERSWARAVLARTFERLRGEFEAAGRIELFNELEPRISGSEHSGGTYAAIAERLGMSESAVGVTVHRMRQRYGELLRAEIAETVADPDEVEAELMHLKSVLTK